MLDQRLLTKLDGNYDYEFKNLEQMKKRFGDKSLHGCDVMLRDIKDSERIDKKIREKRSAFFDSFMDTSKLKVHIITSNFWKQALDDEEEGEGFDLPKRLGISFEDFHKKYQEAKPNRMLTFRSNLGTVKLTLHFSNVSQQFTVTPIQAAIISLFNDSQGNQKTLSAKFIAESLDKKGNFSIEKVR